MARPNNWDKMSAVQRKQWADTLMTSHRGHLILGQALAIAVKKLREVSPPYQETSNIEDMEVLGEEFFNTWYRYFLDDLPTLNPNNDPDSEHQNWQGDQE